jgi:23S rRNA (guanine2445-N2)-methyltransferase / 23S rRNA (guanine2069-N7)-methyltransferase
MNFFATAPRGIESLLAEELRALGADEVSETVAGVAFSGSLETGYRVCLWSRLASRVLLSLAVFAAPSPEALYEGVRRIDWSDHLDAEGTLAVDANIARSAITHSRFAALKVKDALVDQFRERCGVRPSVDPRRPDLRLNLRLLRDEATLSLDLSGESLHRRGYREEGAKAPLKENLAAAILVRAGWPETAASGGALIDPMCGSGTLPLEGALMAADIAPGLLRAHFGFLSWKGHDRPLWENLRVEAQTRRDEGLKRLPPIAGFDADPGAIRAALANAQRAGLQEKVHFERKELAQLTAPAAAGKAPGLVVVNPPYGERLGELTELGPLYACLGSRLKKHFAGWQAAVFTGNPGLGRQTGLRATKVYKLFNGAIPCQLLRFTVEKERYYGAKAAARPEGTAVSAELSEGAQMFANRLRKNLKSIGRWARREGVSCYRLYDADMPEYALAVDRYEQWVHVQEYAPPAGVDPERADVRLREALSALSAVLEVPRERIFLKVRRRQKGRAQYERQDARGEFHEVSEGNCRFLVNFTDYLDTGLFLDHRPTRALLQEMAAGKRFLNLFAYTATASVHAAMGGARSTTSVDLSRTYLAWARKNFALNGFSDRCHEFIQADVRAWMSAEKRRFDLIFLDPPTFSNSKSMAGTFDVQRDHVELLGEAARLLAPGGTLVFSNNNRRFRMDAEALPELFCEEITPRTIPRDFERNPRIHNCWIIRRK